MKSNCLKRLILLFNCLNAFMYSNSLASPSSLMLSNILISYENMGNFTDFVLTSSLRGKLTNVWMTVAIGEEPQMVTFEIEFKKKT